MRIENSIRNTTFSIMAYIIKIAIQFIVRTVFIRTLGAEYLGLNGLFANILSMLSLAELGIGGAIVYSMYKPIAENNEDKIKSLLGFYRIAYFVIGSIVLITGLIATPFLPYIIKDNVNIEINIYLIFLITLSNTVIGYFFAHKRAIIFAKQRNDIEQKVALIFYLLTSAAQIVILIFTKNYYIYILLMPFFTFLDLVVISLIANTKYSFIKEKADKLDSTEKKLIYKNTSALIVHKIGGVVVFSTDSIIISSFLGLAILGFYSNYILIFSSISALINLFSNSVSSSIGNMIAKDNNDKSLKVFNSLNFLLIWIIGFSAICLITLFQPFIKLWLGSSYQLDFLSVVLLAISFYLTASRTITCAFKNSAGLFWPDRYKPIFECIINLVFSILLVWLIGLPGVIIGTIISTISTSLWIEPYVLYKHYFKRSVLPYFGKYFIFTAITVVTGGFTYFLCWLLPVEGVLSFIGKIAICTVVPNMIFLLCYFKTESFKYWVSLIRTLIKKKTKT